MARSLLNCNTALVLYAQQVGRSKAPEGIRQAVGTAMQGLAELAQRHFRDSDAVAADGRLSASGRIERQAEVARASVGALDKIRTDVLGRIDASLATANARLTIAVPAPSAERTLLEIEARSVLRGKPSGELAAIYMTACEQCDDTTRLAIANAPAFDTAFALAPEVKQAGLDARVRSENPVTAAARDELTALRSTVELAVGDVLAQFGGDPDGGDPIRVLLSEHERAMAAEDDALTAELDRLDAAAEESEAA